MSEHEDSVRRAKELSDVIVEDILQLLKRRLDIARHVYSASEQGTAIGMVAERMILTAVGVSTLGVRDDCAPLAARLTATILRRACDRAEAEAPQRVSVFMDELLAGIGSIRK